MADALVDMLRGYEERRARRDRPEDDRDELIRRLKAKVDDLEDTLHRDASDPEGVLGSHLAGASPRAKTIKLADLIDNSRSIVERDPDFAKVYLAEKRELLAVLTDGDETLLNQARAIAFAHTPATTKTEKPR
jgi:hypothetical protein